MPCVLHATWDFTIFPKDGGIDAEIAWLRALEFNAMVAAKETCPDTERVHIQGRVVFKRAYSLAALKKLHGEAHWEGTKCPIDSNYCRKRDSTVVVDEDNRKKKGARTDLEQVKTIVESTSSMRSVLESTMNVQAIRGAEIWLKYNERPRPIAEVEVIWHWGPPGSGKTRAVWDAEGVDNVFQPVSERWWEGYDAHKVVLLDDIRKDWCPFHRLMKLLDIYPVRVECKGGSRQLLAQKIYITSPLPPEHTFDMEEDTRQILRRISTIVEFAEV